MDLPLELMTRTMKDTTRLKRQKSRRRQLHLIVVGAAGRCRCTKIVAIAPLLVIWLGTGWWSKIVAAILNCFFPVLVNTVKGLKAADLEYHELFETMGRAVRRNSASCACPTVCPIFSRR